MGKACHFPRPFARKIPLQKRNGMLYYLSKELFSLVQSSMVFPQSGKMSFSVSFLLGEANGNGLCIPALFSLCGKMNSALGKGIFLKNRLAIANLFETLFCFTSLSKRKVPIKSKPNAAFCLLNG
ncbi:hypothetical protein [Solibaculum intestinale]|uniref:Uncharacterized protein n=1 Tax=Solibaculum intestinale TaxID=3133165 RepID=A0ABV1DYC8_9FIRM